MAQLNQQLQSFNYRETGGIIEQKLFIHAIDDNLVEPIETFSLAIIVLNSTGKPIISGENTVITILDDDGKLVKLIYDYVVVGSGQVNHLPHICTF